MSDTPRTDSLLASKTEPITAVKDFMRTLERELNSEKSEKLKYRVRAWKAESQLETRYGLRKEINEALGLTNETGDDALRKGLETIKALKAERDLLLAQYRERAEAAVREQKIKARDRNVRRAVCRVERLGSAVDDALEFDPSWSIACVPSPPFDRASIARHWKAMKEEIKRLRLEVERLQKGVKHGDQN